MIAEKVVKLLIQKGLSLGTAESCTGGMVSAAIVDISGASDVFKGGIVSYANEAKEKLLGVDRRLLEEKGAVSREVAEAMARGAAKVLQTNAAISTTGIAGPGGGTPDKPVGLVYIGCYVDGKVTVKEYHFEGNRSENREATVREAMKLLEDCLI